MSENPRFNVRLKKLPTSELATTTYSGIAREACAGAPAFEQMDEVAQAQAIADTAYMIAATLFKYGGNLEAKGLDVAWSSFNHPFSKRTEKDSIVFRFRKTLGYSAVVVYGNAYKMLLAGVITREALMEKRKGPPDPLEDICGSRAVPAGQRYDGK
jgi:hypothetical protein